MTAEQQNGVSDSRRFEFQEFGGPIAPQTYQLPAPASDEVLLKVNYCGVCHSDVHLHDGYFELGGDKRLNFAMPLPLTLGHEVIGTVVAVGDQVTGVKPGDQRLIYPWIGCGKCGACQKGEENLCVTPAHLGVNKPGGYADHIVVPHSRYLLDISGLNPGDAATLACSGLTTFSAINKVLPLADDQWIVVIGCGGLGQMALRILQAMGIGNVIGIDLSEEKRKLAQESGARHSFDPNTPKLNRVVAETCPGTVQAALDFVGNEQTAQLALSLLGKGGKYVPVGLHGGELRYPLPIITNKAVSIIGSYVGTLKELEDLVAFAKEKNLPPIHIEHRPLESAAQAVEDLEKGQVAGRVILNAGN
ncbi:hypothetical protein A3Q32_13275 [Alcanivorax sp. KX64203]|nr:hypothetical protein A3Q32_13275 [Alcanivorax sp. KX64203]